MRASLTRKLFRPRGVALAAAAAAALALATWLGVGAPTACAQAKKTTIADYRERVERAARSLDALAVLSKEGRAPSHGEEFDILPETRARTLREVRALVPPTERIERGAGGTLEVDNRWLHTELLRYERTSAADGERAELLRRVVERLRALGQRLGELEASVPASARRDREAEKGRLAEILRGPDFAERAARGGAFARLLENFKQWLSDLLPEWRPPRPETSEGVSTVAQVIVYALAAAVVGYVVWRLWRRRGERAPGSLYRREPRVILGERLAPDQQAADLLDEAERLARAGNTRGAIRKAYVALLCELGDRRVIRLAQNKTNRDYLHSVREHASHLHGLFQPLTHAFERHWYGAEDATAEDWDNFRANCRRAIEAR